MCNGEQLTTEAGSRTDFPNAASNFETDRRLSLQFVSSRRFIQHHHYTRRFIQHHQYTRQFNTTIPGSQHNGIQAYQQQGREEKHSIQERAYAQDSCPSKATNGGVDDRQCSSEDFWERMAI